MWRNGLVEMTNSHASLSSTDQPETDRKRSRSFRIFLLAALVVYIIIAGWAMRRLVITAPPVAGAQAGQLSGSAVPVVTALFNATSELAGVATGGVAAGQAGGAFKKDLSLMKKAGSSPPALQARAALQLAGQALDQPALRAKAIADLQKAAKPFEKAMKSGGGASGGGAAGGAGGGGGA